MHKFVGVSLVAIALAGCNSSTGPGRLSFEGRHNIVVASPLTIQGVVTVRNVGDAPLKINAPADCFLSLEVFTTPDRTGDPVWSSGQGRICDAMARVMTLAPGDYYDYKTTGTLPTLPSARYYLAVSGANSNQHIPVGQIDLF